MPKNRTSSQRSVFHCTKMLQTILFFIALLLGNVCKSAINSNVEGIQVYQKNLQLSPEHKQKLADDITRYRNADNLWDVLREEFTLPHYENNPAVQEKIEWYMNNQDFLLRSATRASPYLYYILQQVKKRHLPAELVLLPIIESGYNPFAISSMGAMGIWQMMPGTASGLGIKRNSWYDGRRDVIASTRGALNYLAYLQSFFDGNWLLAIAAYNTGEGNVLAAIRRNIREGYGTDFWSLPVAQQTKDYVPSLLALAVIISHPDQYPIYFPAVRNAPYLAQVDAGTQINLKYAASLAGISYTKMMQLNSGFKRLSTSDHGPYKLMLPIENVEQFSENLAHSSLNNKMHWFHYRYKTGDTLALVAKKFNTSVASIRKMNHLRANPQHGFDLLIPYNSASAVTPEAMEQIAAREEIQREDSLVFSSKEKKSDDSSHELIATPATNYSLQPGDTIYMVRNKDSLKSIADRFHVSPQTILAVNNFRNHSLKPGLQLIIPAHNLATNMPRVKANNTELQPGDTIYTVRRGDTIQHIAQHYKTTASAIRIANLMINDNVEEGDHLVVPTHIRG